VNLLPDNINFKAWFEAPVNGIKIRKAAEFAGDLEKALFAPREFPRVVTGFDCMLGKFDLRESEMTVWAGPNGQGKSMITTQVALSLCEQGQRVCIASIEMKPYKTLERMVSMAYGTNEPTPKQVREFMAWSDDRLWMYDHVGSVDPQEMIGAVRYAVMELGMQHFFVDNLQKCIANEDDYNGQKAFADKLFAIAKDNPTHVHLIHHTRKTNGTPSKNDVKGASSITDLVDNVVLVYRNMAKEDILSGRVPAKGTEWEEAQVQNDLNLDLVKQRTVGYEGCFPLWRAHDCPQFVEQRGAQPRMYRIEMPKMERPRIEVVDLDEAF
jgi:twinkle protein